MNVQKYTEIYLTDFEPFSNSITNHTKFDLHNRLVSHSFYLAGNHTKKFESLTISCRLFVNIEYSSLALQLSVIQSFQSLQRQKPTRYHNIEYNISFFNLDIRVSQSVARSIMSHRKFIIPWRRKQLRGFIRLGWGKGGGQTNTAPRSSFYRKYTFHRLHILADLFA